MLKESRRSSSANTAVPCCRQYLCGAHHQDDRHGTGAVYLGHVQLGGRLGQRQVCMVWTMSGGARLAANLHYSCVILLFVSYCLSFFTVSKERLRFLMLCKNFCVKTRRH